MIRLENIPLPCEVNRRHSNCRFKIRKNRRTIYATKRVRSQWARSREKLVVAAIHEQLGGEPEPMTGPVMVQGSFHPRVNRNGRIADADAYTKELLDCLAKAGVYVDDSQVVMSPPIERLQPKGRGSMTIEVWEIAE